MFSFPDNSLSKYQQILTKLGMCIDVVEVANGQTLLIFDRLICLLHICISISGPSCSKLTMSLVNDSLKFTLSDTQIC